MPRLTEKLRSALALAEFSNLEPADVDYFRHNYPDFVPQAWWDYRDGGQWKMAQRFLRDTWNDNFPEDIFLAMRALLCVFDPSTMDGLTLSGQPYQPSFAELGDLKAGAYPYQTAVQFLFAEPWRARFCGECKKRFVAAEPKTKYCSEICSHENRNRQKRDWWDRAGRARRDRRVADSSTQERKTEKRSKSQQN